MYNFADESFAALVTSHPHCVECRYLTRLLYLRRLAAPHQHRAAHHTRQRHQRPRPRLHRDHLHRRAHRVSGHRVRQLFYDTAHLIFSEPMQIFFRSHQIFSQVLCGGPAGPGRGHGCEQQHLLQHSRRKFKSFVNHLHCTSCQCGKYRVICKYLFSHSLLGDNLDAITW